MEEKPREFKLIWGPHSQRTRTAWGGSSRRSRPLRSLGRRSPGWCSPRGSTWTWHTRWVYKKMETMSECKRYTTRDARPGEKPLAEARMVKDYTYSTGGAGDLPQSEELGETALLVELLQRSADQVPHRLAV